LPGMSMLFSLPSSFQSESADVDGGDANIHRLLLSGSAHLGGLLAATPDSYPNPRPSSMT
jgi:hypothetical protein